MLKALLFPILALAAGTAWAGEASRHSEAALTHSAKGISHGVAASANAASAMGLTDRGVLETGKRADLIVMDRSDPWRIVHTIAGGSLISFGH